MMSLEQPQNRALSNRSASPKSFLESGIERQSMQMVPRDAVAERLKSALIEQRCETNMWQTRYFESEETLNQTKGQLRAIEAQLKESVRAHDKLR